MCVSHVVMVVLAVALGGGDVARVCSFSLLFLIEMS